ncbi:hypothetical protein [Serratia sp. D1N4]
MNRRRLVLGAMAGISGLYTFSSSARQAIPLSSPLNNVTEINLALVDSSGSNCNLSSKLVVKYDAVPYNEMGVSLADWIFGNVRSIFLYLDKSKVEKIKDGKSVDITSELSSAMSDNVAIFLPNGNYSISKTISVGVNSSLIGAGARNVYIDNQSADHAFKFPIGYARGVKDFSGFSIGCKAETAKDMYAFYFDEASYGKLDYSGGWRFIGIELNGKGMGGGWYLQDCFRVTIRDCGATSLSNPFYIVGSVVQLTVDNFVNNGDDYPDTKLGSYGVYMATKKYTDGNHIKMPEGINFINCKFVHQGIGAYALGLYVQFVNTEFDYSEKCGGLYAGGDKVDFINCYVAPQLTRSDDFVGFLISAMTQNSPEPVLISNCTINMQEGRGGKSYGIVVSGETTYIKSVKIENCFFRGTGYDAGIIAKKINGVVLSGNTFKFSGLSIVIESAKNFTMTNNYSMGEFVIPEPKGDNCWIITGNIGDFQGVNLSDASSCLIINPGLSRKF